VRQVIAYSGQNRAQQVQNLFLILPAELFRQLVYPLVCQLNRMIDDFKPFDAHGSLLHELPRNGATG